MVEIDFFNGNIFEGLFDENGELQGYGQYFDSIGGGCHYRGEFKDHNPHGQGKRVDMDGVIEEGQWEDNRLIRGVNINKDGSKEEGGDFENGKLVKGTATDLKGNVTQIGQPLQPQN